jgi:caffeoyl-CoA O-methyltransferase
MDIQTYAKNHTTPQSEILQQLIRETYLKALKPQMISGHIQGKFLTFFCELLQPKLILEIGTFTGYATICMAKGLADDGILHTIEVDEEKETIIRKYLKLTEVEEKVNLHIGDAAEVIPTIEGTFDLVFIDAAKKHNALYYDMVFDQVRKGGYIITDNVIWYEKVAEKSNDKRTRLIDEFNEKVQNDERVENLLLTVRDGLLIAKKL